MWKKANALARNELGPTDGWLQPNKQAKATDVDKEGEELIKSPQSHFKCIRLQMDQTISSF
jgi:hypothetical protein